MSGTRPFRGPSFELAPSTESGIAFVQLAERHAAEAAPGVDDRDREARFPAQVIESMKATGFLTGAVPAELGGMGVTSLRDLAIGVSRLGRIDPSLAIAVQMHFSISYMAARTARYWREGDQPDNAANYELFLSLLAGGSVALSNHTESGTDLYHPFVTATRSGDGWVLNGRKTFGTSSPVADVLTVGCRIEEPGQPPQVGTAVVLRGTQGLTIHENWDGLGMRASGSNDISYDECPVPDGFISIEGSWGQPSIRNLEVASGANLGLVAAFVGIAEGARACIVEQLTTRKKRSTGRTAASSAGIQHGMAELEVDLASCRAQLDWIARTLDDEFSRPVRDLKVDDLHALNAQFQASKLVVNRAACAVVDKAMQLSGGSGYVGSSALARMYRDVRAGAFMQAFSPNEAYEYIGQHALGQDVRMYD